jgi:metal-responsive CopG/Arc/MetJ family transcriptional regulator
MNTLAVATSGRKINFQASNELYNKANQVAEELNSSLSETIRRAIEEFVEKHQKEKIDQEIIEACKYFYETDKRIAEEWGTTEMDI